MSGADPVPLDVRETIHGPILNEVGRAPRGRAADGAALDGAAVRADHTARVDPRAHDGRDLRRLPRRPLRPYGAPAQNFVYADVDGHIGYQSPGLHARSARTRRTRGSARSAAPTGGTSGSDGSRSTTSPGSSIPSRGWIVTANNAAVDATTPTSSARSGTRAIGPSGSSTCSTATARTA